MVRIAPRPGDTERRENVAVYREAIAGTQGRTGEAFEKPTTNADNRRVRHDARPEIGRISGYIEDIATALEGHLDGRKIAGVKRRLEALVEEQRMEQAIAQADDVRIARLVGAEGYFRALADRLRT